MSYLRFMVIALTAFLLLLQGNLVSASPYADGFSRGEQIAGLWDLINAQKIDQAEELCRNLVQASSGVEDDLKYAVWALANKYLKDENHDKAISLYGFYTEHKAEYIKVHGLQMKFMSVQIIWLIDDYLAMANMNDKAGRDEAREFFLEKVVCMREHLVKYARYQFNTDSEKLILSNFLSPVTSYAPLWKDYNTDSDYDEREDLKSAYSNLYYAQIKHKRYAEAEKTVAREALVFSSDDLLSRLAYVQGQQGNVAGQEATLVKRVQNLKRAKDDYFLGPACVALAELYEKQGRFDLAFNSYSDALSLLNSKNLAGDEARRLRVKRSEMFKKASEMPSK